MKWTRENVAILAILLHCAWLVGKLVSSSTPATSSTLLRQVLSRPVSCAFAGFYATSRLQPLRNLSGGHDKFAETLEQGLLMQAGRHAVQTIFIDQ